MLRYVLVGSEVCCPTAISYECSFICKKVMMNGDAMLHLLHMGVQALYLM